MQELLQSFHELSPLGLIPAAVALVAGLMLWAAGRKVLKWAFAAIGLVLGGLAGWAIGSALISGIAAWIPAIVLGLIGALVAALASRIVIALALAIVLGLGLPALTWTIADATGQYQLPEFRNAPAEVHQDTGPQSPETQPQSPDEPDTEWIQQGIDRLRGMIEDNGAGNATDRDTNAGDDDTPAGMTNLPLDQADVAGEIQKHLGEQVEQATTFLRAFADAARDLWDQAPAALQKLLVLTAALGVLLGLVLGVFLSKLAVSIITSFGGSMLWMLSALTIAGGLGAPLDTLLPASMVLWTGAWVVLAVIGLVIQWTAFRKPADKPA